MNVRSSKSIWGYGGRFDGEEGVLVFFSGGGGGSMPGCYKTKISVFFDLQRLASL